MRLYSFQSSDQKRHRGRKVKAPLCTLMAHVTALFLLFFFSFFSLPPSNYDEGKCVLKLSRQNHKQYILSSPHQASSCPPPGFALSSPWHCRQLAQQRDPQCCECGALSDCQCVFIWSAHTETLNPHWTMFHLTEWYPRFFVTSNCCERLVEGQLSLLLHALPLMDVFIMRYFWELWDKFVTSESS